MVFTIKKRIWGSFLALTAVFVINGAITILILSKSKVLSDHVEQVIDPAQQLMQDLKMVLIESKMYTTNWVFLRSNQEDKNALRGLHSYGYPYLRAKINDLLPALENQPMADSIHHIFQVFEQLKEVERGVMLNLNSFDDYDDPTKKMMSEQILEDKVIPVSNALISSVDRVLLNAKKMKFNSYTELENYRSYLKTLISILAVSVIGMSVLLSYYFTKVITTPIRKIRQIINDLGKGIIHKVNYSESRDEIGQMVASVNNLSEKLLETATFAREIGNRNFTLSYTPLSEEDQLGKALLTMRDNLKVSEESLMKTSSNLIRRHKVLEQYTYIISHNLRSPVATMCGLADILAQPGLDPEDNRTIVDGLTQSARKLDKVIFDLNQILELKNDLHQIREKIIFDQLVEDTRFLFKNSINTDDITFHCDFSEVDHVHSIKSYLSSIFFNLISNSIKYRRPDTKLNINISSTQGEHTTILSFRDNGKGIDLNKNQEDLFGLYKRFDFSVEGKGMGLFMVRSQIEELNGTISCNSIINVGTEFRIEFPRHQTI